jgi:UDP-N-acetylmuramate--alanine ligase
VRAAELARLIEARGGNVARAHETDEIKKLLRSALRPGDVLVTMGAGDIGKVAHEFVQRL